jgi:hypothetical protein
MSRDPERIDLVLDAVRTAWKAAPDLRLTQLLANTTRCETSAAFYNVEDDVLEQLLRTPPERASGHGPVPPSRPGHAQVVDGPVGPHPFQSSGRFLDYGYAEAPLCRVCGQVLTDHLHDVNAPPGGRP